MKQQIIYFVLIISACSNLEQFDITEMDLTPPTLEEISMTGSNQLTIKANETITLDLDSSNICQDISIVTSSATDNTIEIVFDRELKLGEEYQGSFRIVDENGNSLSFLSRFYGYNPNMASVIINEFTVKGSKTNPNKIELYVTKGGNTGGLTLYNGTKYSYDYIYTFPDLQVNTGEYIVIRTCSDTYPIPFMETDNLSINHDKKFIPDVRDIRIESFKLSSTNGTLTLYTDPYGTVMDCVIYSKNRNDDEKRYRNFGLKKTLDRIDELVADSDWIVDGDLARPEDVIYIGNSTSTRSLNRFRMEDSDNKDNWYTVDSREYSFGYPNSEKIYD